MILSTPRRARVLQALERANNHPTSGWHLGIYDGDTKILALAAAFYSTPTDRYNPAALFCRLPHYIRMPNYLGRKAHFSLGSWDMVDGFTVPSDLEDTELFILRIEVAEWDSLFYLVCEDVRFYHPAADAHQGQEEENAA